MPVTQETEAGGSTFPDQTRDIAQLVECLPSIHKDLDLILVLYKLGVLVCVVTLALGR